MLYNEWCITSTTYHIVLVSTKDHGYYTASLYTVFNRIYLPLIKHLFGHSVYEVNESHLHSGINCCSICVDRHLKAPFHVWAYLKLSRNCHHNGILRSIQTEIEMVVELLVYCLIWLLKMRWWLWMYSTLCLDTR